MNLIAGLLLLLPINAGVFSSSEKTPAEKWANEQMKNMTLEQKVGQLIFIRAHSDLGREHIKSVEESIKKYHVGGLCFFQGSPEVQAKLTNRYQAISKTPLMIAIDAEWGLGMRFKEKAISFPKQLTLGAIEDNNIIYDMGKAVAEDLKRIGVHINFAPVVDINNNADNPVIHNRSFGEDLYNVSTKAYAYMKGMQDNGIIACAKHFPGHGDTDTDSHLDLPVINHSRRRIDSLELMPFRVLSQLGVQSMMSAHLHVPALDNRENRATSLSKKVIDGILREQLHFEGLVFTDALEMEGVAKFFEPGEVEVEAIMAGNDILLLPKDIKSAVDGLVKAVKSDRLSEDIINQKVRKILIAKFNLGLTSAPVIGSLDDIPADVNSRKSMALKSLLYEKAVTLVKNEGNIIPIKYPQEQMYASLSLGSKEGTPFQVMLDRFGVKRHFNVDKTISLEAETDLMRKLSEFDAVIIGIHDMSLSSSKSYGITRDQFNLIYKLNSQKKVVLVSFGSPYALKFFKGIPVIVQAYEDDPFMQEIVAQGLFGVFSIKGVLPVTADSSFPVHTGIQTPNLYRLGYSLPEGVGVNADSLLAIDTIIDEMINTEAAPGCQIIGVRKGRIFYEKTFGHHTYDKKKKVEMDDIYDVASVTKILASTISLMHLVDSKKLDLFEPLKTYLPELDTTNKGDLIIEDVLAHHSGLPGWIPFYEETVEEEGKKVILKDSYYRVELSDTFSVPVCEQVFLRSDYTDSIYQIIYNCELRDKRDYRYSDLGFYLFHKVINKLTGKDIAGYAADAFYNPLGLEHTLFNPLGKVSADKLPPTERDNYFRNQVIKGYVHDMGAAMLGGVSGHAGLFSNANDLAVLMQMLLNGGVYGGTKYLRPETIRKFTKRYFRSTRRGLGFDMKELDPNKTPNMSEKASEMTFGHLGFTGTAVFADPKYDLVFIFLSNRTFPSMDNNKFSHKNYRPRVQTVFYNAIEDAIVP